jgi:hypothetical protein
MKSYSRDWPRCALRVAGALQMTVGVAHGGMMLCIPGKEGFAGSIALRNFTLLVTAATGWLLLVLGTLFVLGSVRSLTPRPVARILAATVCVGWVGRGLLEVALPVRFPLWFVAFPSPYVFGLTAFLVLLGAIAFMGLGEARERSTGNRTAAAS